MQYNIDAYLKDFYTTLEETHEILLKVRNIFILFQNVSK